MQLRFVYSEIGKESIVKNLHKFNIAVACELKFYDVSGIFNSFFTQRDILFLVEKSFISESLSFLLLFFGFSLNLKD